MSQGVGREGPQSFVCAPSPCGTHTYRPLLGIEFAGVRAKESLARSPRGPIQVPPLPRREERQWCPPGPPRGLEFGQGQVWGKEQEPQGAQSFEGEAEGAPRTWARELLQAEGVPRAWELLQAEGAPARELEPQTAVAAAPGAQAVAAAAQDEQAAATAPAWEPWAEAAASALEPRAGVAAQALEPRAGAAAQALEPPAEVAVCSREAPPQGAPLRASSAGKAAVLAAQVIAEAAARDAQTAAEAAAPDAQAAARERGPPAVAPLLARRSGWKPYRSSGGGSSAVYGSGFSRRRGSSSSSLPVGSHSLAREHAPRLMVDAFGLLLLCLYFFLFGSIILSRSTIKLAIARAGDASSKQAGRQNMGKLGFIQVRAGQNGKEQEQKTRTSTYIG
ncbi:leucine zipper transcription factor-like protein 1 isoform X2 [Brienomyrus brachyistius]|uniref:leucine zipper transcription factor-like protein 1 isoform X2 n=1 Tax=Brienomyrus brachyistius TaxID=42636 RepID=UPI0020B26864|nr:leucine zipper transcription factor-like protein 1 isoform X2 [Brienomyrus brachyistius]XP_048827926.1 leucine zipper transcription factor-like protein 1 isoform X2 [Brienomyrus brachyistius]